MRRHDNGEELEYSKSQLVREIITNSTLFSSCSHIRNLVRNSGFIDWYLILRINEDSEVDVIRRRYRQLALQVHPDKNRHPKAEIAFKLISEAYECLSDEAKRTTFNSNRRTYYCWECHKKKQSQHPDGQKNHKDNTNTKRSKFLRAFREVQNRFKDECQVMESCLRSNEATSGTGFPIFDPSDRMNFPEYPHLRAQVREKHLRDEYRYYSSSFSSRFNDWKSRCESSPVYEVRSERRQSGFRF